ncbi:MAG: hypothetical protein ACNS60_02355 [Candidatus Cyclobacteriaceae bacterium M2_1C_046]
MIKLKKHYKKLARYLICLGITMFYVIPLKAQNQIDCIQGVWRGLMMDIEPHADLSKYYMIVKNDSIISYYLDQNNIFHSNFKFIDFDITKENTSFYNVDIKNLLSNSTNEHSKYFYTEIDIDSNVAVDKYFFCNNESLTKLHFEFEKLSFLPFSAYSNLKNKTDASELNISFIQNYIKKGKIIINRSYFHSQPDYLSKRKDFVVEGDIVIVDEIKNDWIKVAYEGKNVTTTGWLKTSDLVFVE